MNTASKKRAILIGANGTIGSSLADLMRSEYELYTLSREDTDYSEASLEKIRTGFAAQGAFSTIICCIGSLHSDKLAPEKKLDQVNEETLSEYFRINTILPALCIRYFQGLLDKQAPAQFCVLSAMVGSIGDNRLGGWYGYRGSKAALNQIVRTASIEVARTNKNACLAAVHPGTTIGPLTKPFSAGIAKNKYYTPEQSAKRILRLSEALVPEQTGRFFNWDGSELQW